MTERSASRLNVQKCSTFILFFDFEKKRKTCSLIFEFERNGSSGVQRAWLHPGWMRRERTMPSRPEVGQRPFERLPFFSTTKNNNNNQKWMNERVYRSVYNIPSVRSRWSLNEVVPLQLVFFLCGLFFLFSCVLFEAGNYLFIRPPFFFLDFLHFFLFFCTARLSRPPSDRRTCQPDFGCCCCCCCFIHNKLLWIYSSCYITVNWLPFLHHCLAEENIRLFLYLFVITVEGENGCPSLGTSTHTRCVTIHRTSEKGSTMSFGSEKNNPPTRAFISFWRRR